ncbi:MAG: MFS transporter [Burkholderiales bacterium]
MYLLIFAINAVTAFFTPAFEASLPDVVGSEHYVKAVSLSRIAVDVESVASPALAGLLLAAVGLRWLFWFDAITYLVSALLVFLSAIRSTPVIAAKLRLKSFFAELAFGTCILLREISLRRALLLSFVEATAGAVAIVSTVVYARDVLLLGDTAFALLMAGLGLGSTVTALLLSRITGRYESRSPDQEGRHARQHRWADSALLIGGMLLGLLLLPGFMQPAVFWFALLWMFNGAGQALIAIPSSTLLAAHTVSAERGRAYAAYFALTHAFWLITYPAVGHATSAFGAPITFTVAGGVCLLITLMVFITTRQKFVPHVHSEKSSGANTRSS